jgi:enoyl-CoA hydratase/carnithine racemase
VVTRGRRGAGGRGARVGGLKEREVDLAVALMDTEDFAEGIAAFGERRQPVFRGR